MRFLYLGSFRLPNGDAAAARVLNVARALRLAGHEVSFISWGGYHCPENLCDDSIYRVDGFPYIVTNEIDFKGNQVTKALSWLTKGNKTKAILKKTLGEFDAIINYNGCLVNWLLPFCRRHNIALISDLTEWYSYKELKLVERPLFFINMHFAQKCVRNKIVISSYLDRYFGGSHNIVVPATCNATEDKWHQGAAAAKEKVSEFDGITLIYAGTPARKDAVHYAINAVQRLIDEVANIRFLIVGAEREQYIRNYSDLLTKKDLSERIQFLGRVSQDEVPSYYSLADFMVLLRDQTRKSNAGFPTKFAESFTSGTPVIANLTSDLGQYLHDGRTGFVVSEPSEEAIYHVLKDRVLPLSRELLNNMKKNVQLAAKQLDYHAYVEPLRIFMNGLK